VNHSSEKRNTRNLKDHKKEEKKVGEEKQVYDLIIVGAGPAGLTAGIHTSRLGLKTLVLEAGTPGGRASEASIYENFPGFPEGIMGKELIKKMEKQISKFGAEIKAFEEVIDLDFGGELKKVATSKAIYHSFALIIATGTQRRKLEVPGETEFLGRGVSYCRVCDGPFFKGLRVAVVGFAKEAIMDSLFLADIAKEVLLITDEKKIEVAEDLKRRLLERANVKIVNGKVVAILGENVVEAVKVVKFETKQEVRAKVNGVFISLGWVPTTEIVKKAGIEVDDRGCIKVDRWQRTNIEGVFAAGDCTCGGMQIVTATGEGAMAATKALTYIKWRKQGEAKP
jgi:thioredoxin reductase (NADPH)